MQFDVDPNCVGRCSKCGDRIIGEFGSCKALDQLYHLHCFRCEVCQKYLGGMPFHLMGDKPYCEDDYYLKNTEICCLCAESIPDEIFYARSKPYHPRCFACSGCGVQLKGKSFNGSDGDDRLYCDDCFNPPPQE